MGKTKPDAYLYITVGTVVSRNKYIYMDHGPEEMLVMSIDRNTTRTIDINSKLVELYVYNFGWAFFYEDELVGTIVPADIYPRDE